MLLEFAFDTPARAQARSALRVQNGRGNGA